MLTIINSYLHKMMQKEHLSLKQLDALISHCATGYHITNSNEDPIVLRPFLSKGLPLII